MAAPAKPEDEDNPRRDGMWDSLPQDLLFLVFSLLSLSQLIRAAAVCKFWLRTAVASAANDRRQLPWLLVTATDEFYSFSEDQLYRFRLPNDFLHGGYWASGVQGIHQDWVVFSSSSPTLVDGKRFFPLVFYNPFSRRRIDLPPVPAGHRNYPHRSTSNIVFSSSPHDPACVAAFVRDKSQGIGFCNVAAANSGWQMIPCRSEYRGIAFYQGSLYVTTPDGALHVVPTSTGLPEIQHDLLPAPTWCGVPARLKDHFLFRRICGSPNEGRSYSLVVSGDDRLLLVCFMGGDGVRSRTFTIAPIALYEANFKLGSWELADNLMGKALFLGTLTSVVVNPDVFGHGIEGDCIYHYGHYAGVSNDVGGAKYRISKQIIPTHYYNLVKEEEGTAPQHWLPLIRDKGRDVRRSFMVTPKPFLLRNFLGLGS